MKYVGENSLKKLITLIKNKLDTKVDKVSGKGLSTNDYTSAEKTKLSGIATGANKYSLPVAGAALGGIKSGTDIAVDKSGNVSVGEGVVTSKKLAKDAKNIVFMDTSVEVSSFVEDTTLNGFSYKCSIALTDVLDNMVPEIIFTDAQNKEIQPSINSWSVDGGVYFYCVDKPSSNITIPTIIMHRQGTTGTTSDKSIDGAVDMLHHAARHLPSGADPLVCQTENFGNKTITASKIVDAARTQYWTLTVSTTWEGDSAPYTQSITADGMLETDKPKVYKVAPASIDDIDSYDEEFAKFFKVESLAGSLKLYAKEATTAEITIAVEVNRI